jgi:hypothetical protein
MRAHLLHADSDRMSDKTRATGGHDPGRRYEIHVRGSIGPTMMQVFPTLAACRSGQDTVLSGSLPDQSALYGVIHELEALGLELLEVRSLPVGYAGRGARSTRGCSPS